MAEHGHLSLQDVVGGLALRQGGLTRAQLVEALVEGGGRPGGRGGDVPHHDVDRIWKINKSVNKIRIRIQFYQVQKQVTSIVVYLKPADWLDKTNGNLYILSVLQLKFNPDPRKIVSSYGTGFF
jgi:hypothetical protein